MTQTILPPIQAVSPGKDEQLAQLAKRYRGSRGVGMQLVGLLGSQADGLLGKLPETARARLDDVTMSALNLSFEAAALSRKTAPESGDWLTRAMAMGTGAAGGMGGLPTALAEIPVTTTVILRAIQSIAVEHGFDPSHEDTRADCLQVFAAAGPLAEDDDTDLSFLTLRMTVTGISMQALLAKVAPRLALVLGQKLAAQTVPVLGAAAGAAINYSFTSYYQDMARVQFGLRKLAETGGYDRAALTDEFQNALKALAK